MAICDFCNKDMLVVDNCDANDTVKFPDGSEMTSIPYENEYDRPTCHDCGVAKGNKHHPGCDMERCPICTGQLISCGCLDDEDNE